MPAGGVRDSAVVLTAITCLPRSKATSTVIDVGTGTVLAVKVALVAPVGTVTLEGTPTVDGRPLVSVTTHHRVRDAITLLHEHRVSQLPVVSAADPGTVVGRLDALLLT